MSDNDLIRRGDALKVADAEMRRYGFGLPGGRGDQMQAAISTIPAVQPTVSPELLATTNDVAVAAIVVADAIDADMQSFNALVQGFEARPDMPVRHFFSKALRHYSVALARVKGDAK